MKKVVVAALLLSGCASMQNNTSAENLHDRLLTLDTHLDTPLHFKRPGWSFADRHDLASDLVQVDIPRMADGHLDGGFFVIYTEQGPLTAQGYAGAGRFAFQRSDEIDATIARHSDKIGFARTADEVERLAAQGKLIALKSMENSYPLGEDLRLLSDFHRRGVRMAGPVHSSNNQFADSATDKPRWNGLSPLGRQWVAEMNRLGIVIDGSHSSDAAFDEMLALSKTPLILSHSGSKQVWNNPRNIDDARIRRLAAAGGAICVTTVFLSDMNMTKERAELFGLFGEIGELSPAQQADLTARWRALDQRESLWAADFEDFMKAVLHVADVAGPDHVCFGADWDGGGGIKGIEDISAFPKVTQRLKAAGYSDADIQKMWSGNILRIMRAAEAAAN